MTKRCPKVLGFSMRSQMWVTQVLFPETLTKTPDPLVLLRGFVVTVRPTPCRAPQGDGLRRAGTVVRPDARCCLTSLPKYPEAASEEFTEQGQGEAQSLEERRPGRPWGAGSVGRATAPAKTLVLVIKGTKGFVEFLSSRDWQMMLSLFPLCRKRQPSRS